MKNFLMKLWMRLCLKPFFTRRMPDGFMLCSKLGVNFFSSQLLYPNMQIRLRLIRVRPNLYMISDNRNFSLGSVDRSIYTCHIPLKDDSQKKRMDILPYAPVEFT